MLTSPQTSDRIVANTHQISRQPTLHERANYAWKSRTHLSDTCGVISARFQTVYVWLLWRLVDRVNTVCKLI